MAAEKIKYNYGGQAVIEGVMIRGRTTVVTAVRRSDGQITTDTRPLHPATTGKLRRIPLIRGIVVLIEAMVIGIQSLMYSANAAVEEEDEEVPTKALWLMVGVGVVLVVLLFFLVPLFLTNLLNQYLPNTIVFNLVEGAIRIVIFLLYLKLIGLMPDIKRVFTYHGAEHKTVNAYEAGVPLEVEHVKKYGTAHVRCGTSFLFLVLIIAVFVFAFIGRDILWLMIVGRIVLIPVIMALGYEVIYFGAKHSRNWLIRPLLWPGLLLQSMTTGEPDDSQIEVAIASMNKAIEVDRADEAASAPTADAAGSSN